MYAHDFWFKGLHSNPSPVDLDDRKAEWQSREQTLHQALPILLSDAECYGAIPVVFGSGRAQLSLALRMFSNFLSHTPKGFPQEEFEVDRRCERVIADLTILKDYETRMRDARGDRRKIKLINHLPGDLEELTPRSIEQAKEVFAMPEKPIR